MIQSMPDASPIRWHLAHTSWFFETFVLKALPGYRCYDENFQVLFNSYYNSVGDQFPRPERGLVSRPGLAEVLDYRHAVDQAMEAVLSQVLETLTAEQIYTVDVGLNHEQQHQELMLTDIKHALSCNPTLPAYCDWPLPTAATPSNSLCHWKTLDEGTREIGWHSGVDPATAPGFCYDNELPRHRVFLEPYSIATQPVTCRQYIEFIEDGGYERPELWLSLGWASVQEQGWKAPLYWLRQSNQQNDTEWMQFTLSGLQPVQLDTPVCHVSYFEADAFARWSGARLPTEAEWEWACRDSLPSSEPTAPGTDGQFADHRFRQQLALHPAPVTAAPDKLSAMLGGVWEWTSSSYAAYPGYRPPPGALGEYNGKFMCNQYVLRGGSVATSSDHIRTTYRNFFPPDARWQFSGIRLASSRMD